MAAIDWRPDDPAANVEKYNAKNRCAQGLGDALENAIDHCLYLNSSITVIHDHCDCLSEWTDTDR